MQYQDKIRNHTFTLDDGIVVNDPANRRGPMVFKGTCTLLSGREHRPSGVGTQSIQDQFIGEMYLFGLSDGRFFRAGVAGIEAPFSPDVQYFKPVTLERNEAEAFYNACQESGETFAPLPE